MLSRWCNEFNSINLAFFQLKRICRKAEFLKGGRGRKPKREIEGYTFTLVLKEFDKRTLRSAEEHISKFVFNERVDHSVRAYWENKPEIVRYIQIIISRAGKILDKRLRKIFSFVDATKFTTWNIKETQIHVANRIAQETVYPIGASFLKKNIRDPVNEALPKGYGRVYLDADYDDNKTIKILFEKGYYPIVCPNKNRWRGYWRKKARKLYGELELDESYFGGKRKSDRGRGESLFGSLTNEFGDRLHARNEQAMQARVLGRIISYKIKLLIQCNDKIISIELIIRHAQEDKRYKNVLRLKQLMEKRGIFILALMLYLILLIPFISPKDSQSKNEDTLQSLSLFNFLKTKFGTFTSNLITFVSVNSSPGIDSCTDSDGGLFPGKNGSIVLSSTRKSDECIVLAPNAGVSYSNVNFCSGEKCALIETYCTGESSDDWKLYSCSNGCSNGACVNGTTEIIGCLGSNSGNVLIKGFAAVSKPRVDALIDTCLIVAPRPGVTSSVSDSCSGGNCRLLETFCSSNELFLEYYSCSNGCTNGACVNGATEIIGCSDSDSGKNYLVQGFAEKFTFVGGLYGHLDNCFLNNPDGYTNVNSCSGSNCNLREYFCSSGDILNEPVPCPNGCVNGQCVQSCTNQCTNSQKRCNGNYVQTCADYNGDSCYEWGSDYYCGGSTCYNGACIERCSDTDGGINYSVLGVVSTSDKNYIDSCYENSLTEWYCSVTEPKNTTYNCSYICKDGKCITNNSLNNSLTCDDARKSRTNCTNYCNQFSGFMDVVFYNQSLIGTKCGKSGYCRCLNQETDKDIICSFYEDNTKWPLKTCSEITDTFGCDCFCRNFGGYNLMNSLNQEFSYPFYLLGTNGPIDYCICFNSSVKLFESINIIGECYKKNVSCTDSDGGKNYFVEGYVKLHDGNIYYDECGVPYSDGTVALWERICEKNLYPTYSKYQCPNGCSNRACISGSQTPNQTSNQTSSKSSFAASNIEGESESGSSGERDVSASAITKGSSSDTISDFLTNIEGSKIIGQQVEIKSDLNLVESDGKVYAENKNSNFMTEIKINPDIAIKKAKETLRESEVKEVKIEEYKNQVIYNIVLEKKVKLLAVINKYAKINIKINVDKGEVVKIDFPWWSILATGF